MKSRKNKPEDATRSVQKAVQRIPKESLPIQCYVYEKEEKESEKMMSELVKNAQNDQIKVYEKEEAFSDLFVDILERKTNDLACSTDYNPKDSDAEYIEKHQKECDCMELRPHETIFYSYEDLRKNFSNLGEDFCTELQTIFTDPRIKAEHKRREADMLYRVVNYHNWHKIF